MVVILATVPSIGVLSRCSKRAGSNDSVGVIVDSSAKVSITDGSSPVGSSVMGGWVTGGSTTGGSTTTGGGLMTGGSMTIGGGGRSVTVNVTVSV
ncbi:hypothetical protein COS66_00810 [Candidatus Berkelbacteria bacterium CG06_land_8_20_14_3_00_43_10]|uniref:Uncharacterized protein n=1 Tax=Candidatus Berkelbacteria bacterium CG10_big_fil_rev_8_21_14_0_10_43_14 TaxID=1974515 RepID=A0A2M6R7W0_9BACT|nr:MAG: hypothetical protein COT79_03595 [Candidatus Berkelbacteria bacterium CG10_big_fil_rev_8_21_14_0_10_43_14]PIU87446.1 MAG: hypothetical protein COS66_00810 [Candidatus Berkelbacteria bacterium CG06_land_8_20_14_3_00_43_10]